MDPTGKAILAFPFAESGNMATNPTPTTGEDPNLALVRFSPTTLQEELPLRNDYDGRRTDGTPTFDEWEAIKSIFTYYYMVKDYPLRTVQDIMARRYTFNATERMYKHRVKQWELFKNKKRVHENTPRTVEDAGPRQSTYPVLTFNGRLDSDAGHLYAVRLERRRRRRSSSLASLRSGPRLVEVNGTPTSSSAYPLIDGEDESNPTYLILPRRLPAPDQDRHLEDILVHIDRYYLSCFHGQGSLFPKRSPVSRGVGVVDVDDGFTDMGLLEIHDPGYAAISLAKSRQYREARIFLGEAQDKLKTLLRAQHPTLLPFILEIICEHSTTPEFNVSEWFRQYVCDLCAIIMGERHSLTMILQLLGLVNYKLETCAMILSKIQAILSAEFGATKWEARRPVKVYCRVLRHLGRYDEVERILPKTVGLYSSTETPIQSELLGLRYEQAWLSARGRHDYQAATELFEEILRLTGRDAQVGKISHFRIKALRGLGVLAREEGRHEVSARYFTEALRDAKRGFGRRDSNTVRIGSELEESLRELGRSEEADGLRREREELFMGDEEALY